MQPNPDFFAMRMRGAKNPAEIKAVLEEALAASDSLGEPAIKDIKRIGQEKAKELKVKNIINSHWHRQHKVNGAQKRQMAIAATESNDELMLVLDPCGETTGTKHSDPNAIALISPSGDQVGYISAKPKEFGGREGGLAKWLTDRMKSGENWTAFVVAKVGQGKASLGLRINLVQLKGDEVTDWPCEVKIEEEPIVEPAPINIDLMDKKMKEIYENRELLAPEVAAKFRKIRSFRVKFGTYSENCLQWLDDQIVYLKMMMSI